MASITGSGALRLYSISRSGQNIARLGEKEVVVHAASGDRAVGIIQTIRLEEPFASQVRFLRFSRSPADNVDEGKDNWNLLNAVSCRRGLCASDTRASVWQLNSPDWYAEIENIDPDLTNLDFGSSDNEVIIFHNWNTKVTIFNLDTGRSQIIRSPKFSTVNGYGYRPRTGQFAILLKPETVDLLTIHEFQTYELISKVVLPTVDAHGLKWSPDGKWIAVWEGGSAGTKLLVYTADGQLFRTHTGPQGSDNTFDLGVRNIEWSPSIGDDPTASLLAVGKFDGTVDILNGKTLSCSTTLSHVFHIGNQSPRIWRERYSGKGRLGYFEYAEASSSSAFMSTSDPSGLPRGISIMLFSCDGSLLATLDQSRPNVVWIWSLRPIPRLESALTHEHSVKQFTWHPREPKLLIMTNNTVAPIVHHWSLNEDPVIAHILTTPTEAGRYEAAWVSDDPSVFWFSTPTNSFLGYIAMIDDRAQFCLLYTVDEGESDRYKTGNVTYL
ncbi:hypothetical protein Egran_03043 [Elaphomyces granulatus]|uniref:Anaphase-promoting complex subunit 4 WD40 domain-containing protein n=1 Tax=Elaphomyces granulatus TaxID=519963 RepID=A0A232LYQ1_9EURO|nr:hypothetical protein Egran_03043 [Elaphomyces granulatus]